MGNSWIDDFLDTLGGAQESVLPTQVINNINYSGETRLVFAILEDAIRVFLRYDPVGNKPPIYFDTMTWFYSDGWWPFSFLSVCEILGIDAGAFRKRLRDRKITNPVRRQVAA